MKTPQHSFLILSFIILSIMKSYSQESALVSGGNAIGTGGTVSYSIGQVTYASETGNNGIVFQGVQQPYEISSLGNDDFTEIKLVMSVYPNPATDLLNLVVSDDKWNNLSYQFYDINGRTLSHLKKITASETNVSMQELQQGIYFLAINSENKTIKTFKIIKKQSK